MPRISDLQIQQRDPERVNVYLEGAFAFGVTRLVAASHRLRIGQELTPEEIEVIQFDESAERAFNTALNFLSFRPRSRAEIEDYFRRRHIEDSTGEAVIERLRRAGLVNDEEFARFWVENRSQFRPRGSRALKAELRQKGVDTGVIEAALDGLGDESALAYDAATRKARAYARLDDREYFNRMVSHLQRRGFPYGIAADATRRLLQERGGDAPDHDVLGDDTP